MKKAPLPLLTGAVVCAVVLAAIGPWPVGVFYDDGIYVILAKALATGEGYRYLNLPGTPAAIHYPPGYPALLALLWKIWPDFPRNLLLFKVANAGLLGLGAGAACALGIRAGLSGWAASAAALCGGIAIPVLATSTVLFSEPLFLALLVPVLMAADRACEEGASERRIAAIAAAVGVVGLVRTAALPLLPAFALVLMWRHRWRAAMVALAAGAAMLAPWQLWVFIHRTGVPPILSGSYGSYLAWALDGYRSGGLPFAVGLLRHNAEGIERITRTFVSPVPALPIRAPMVLFSVGLVLAGIVLLWRRSHRVSAMFLAGYLALVAFWPYAPDRFLWAIWPLVLLAWTLSADAIRAWRPEAAGGQLVRAAGVAAVVVAVFCYLRYNVDGLRRSGWDKAQRTAAEQARPAIEWVLAYAGPDDLVSTDTDPMMYLYTGRRSIPNTSWTAGEYLAPQRLDVAIANLQTLLSRYRPDWLTVGSGMPAMAAERLWRMSGEGLELEGTLRGGGAVFRVNSSGGIAAH